MVEHCPPSLEPQDWLIIAEALILWRGPPNEAESARERRAWELVELIARDQGLAIPELYLQVDEEWGGPNEE
jgi:hypothetical protein